MMFKDIEAVVANLKMKIGFLWEAFNKPPSFIWITTQIDLLHSYPNAPKEVLFLKNLHRHLFKIKVSIEIFHNDRDLEFFMVQEKVNTVLAEFKRMYNSGSFSCEMISDFIAAHLQTTYPKRTVQIEVSEDGENGSFKTYKWRTK